MERLHRVQRPVEVLFNIGSSAARPISNFTSTDDNDAKNFKKSALASAETVRCMESLNLLSVHKHFPCFSQCIIPPCAISSLLKISEQSATQFLVVSLHNSLVVAQMIVRCLELRV